ncbi:proline-rich protein 3 isoform X4 [Macaca fascicularis]|uniref:proline-rich protein 3 isoform X4 n=1 Tax=Macaca fascicularis TaxID=9541 RepID=UPI003D159DFA
MRPPQMFSATFRKWNGGSLGIAAHRPPGSGNRIPACPFLTTLQIPLQPLPQPRCRNERSRISTSHRHSSNPHCPSGKRLEMRRMGVPSDHPAFWALPPWPMENLATLSQPQTGYHPHVHHQ